MLSAKEAKLFLSFIYTIDTKNKNSKICQFYNRHYITFKTWKMCNVKTSTCIGIIWISPSPSCCSKFEMRRRNIILLYYYYSVYTNICKCICAICWIQCEHKPCVDQLDKYWLPNCAPSYQPSYTCVEKCYYKKYLNITTIWSSWNS